MIITALTIIHTIVMIILVTQIMIMIVIMIIIMIMIGAAGEALQAAPAVPREHCQLRRAHEDRGMI